MKTFSEYIQEHNPLAVKSLIKKVNPLDKQMRQLKRMKKMGVKGLVLKGVQKKVDKLMPGRKRRRKEAEAEKKELVGLKKEREKLDKQNAKLSKTINDKEDIIYGRK